MINLNHINLSVKDVPAASDIFIKYLGFKAPDQKPGNKLAILYGDNNFLLVLMDEQMNENGINDYPGVFHIGFYLEDEKAVNGLYEQLKRDNIIVSAEPKRIRKTFGFYFYLQNVLIEIASELSDPGQ